MLLYGASGHAKVICSALESINENIIGIFDDNPSVEHLHGYKVVTGYDKDYQIDDQIIIAVGDNLLRKKLSLIVEHTFGKCVALSASCDKTVFVGKGSVLLHQVVVQRDTTIGNHCIINTSSSIDHDCMIEDFVHVSPGASICGGVTVGEGSHIGAGVTIIPNIRIGKWCVIGAGSVVIKDIPDHAMVVGVPGKIIKMLK